MKYIKCPICELNFIDENQDMCGPCKEEIGNPIIKNYCYTGCFFVFQGASYEEELIGNYIKAPAMNDNKIIHHWERMIQVERGDFILHGNQGRIVALSIAKSSAYLWNYSQKYESKMRRIDLDTVILPKSIFTRNNIKKLLSMQPDYHAPFNKNGDGNQGYLFVIFKEMVQFVINKSYDIRDINQKIIKEILIQRYEERFKTKFNESDC